MKWWAAAAALCREPVRRGSAPAAAALRGSSSAPIAACRVRSRGDQLGRKPRYSASSVFSGAAGSRLRLPGILPISAAASCRRLLDLTQGGLRRALVFLRPLLDRQHSHHQHILPA